VQLVVRQALLPAGLGLAVGLLACALAGTAVRAFLFALPTLDGISTGVLAVAVALLSLVATAVPARRALSVNPIVALRNE
jgi:ABC-type antimicrobial peptide transport system permease subunit